ncbi:MAG TPA: c-type cytochrome [Pyrinomonadaceae bacterium]|nr:c-type cytochrome [Pyrinomonadaceae bacterium]
MKGKRLRVAVVFAALMCLAAVLAGGEPRAAETAARLQSGDDAAALFAKHCAKCHGKDGRAKTLKAKFNKARDLTDARWQKHASDERIFNSITQGGGKMPAFKKKLSSAQIERLVVYVRGLKK